MISLLNKKLWLVTACTVLIATCRLIAHAQNPCPALGPNGQCGNNLGQPCQLGAESGKCANSADTGCFCQTKEQRGYILDVSPMTPSPITPGTSASSTITITPVGGYTGTVHLTCSTNPPVLTCNSGSVLIDVPGSPFTETITTTDAKPGQYQIYFVGNDANGVAPNNGNPQTAALVISPNTGYVLNVGPMTPTQVQGGTPTSATVSITPVGGYVGTVTVTCASGGKNVTCNTPSVNVSVPTGGTITETVSTTGAHPGSYKISFAATDQNGLTPNNGNPQDSDFVIPNGGGVIAFGTFAGLSLVWLLIGPLQRAGVRRT